MAYPKTKKSCFDRTIFGKTGLTLRRLKGLVEVAEHGGIAAAAGHNPVRQSQLSTDLKKLSAYFDVKLVHSHSGKKTVTITPEGKRLAALAKDFLTSLEDLRRVWKKRRLAL
jgi:DNA-binding transcriptional LysR family regulator